MTLVRADLNPVSCVPPSVVLMLLANESRLSLYPSVYCIATSAMESSREPST